MKAVFEVELPKQQTQHVLRIIRSEKHKNYVLHVSHFEKGLRFELSAASFSALRAKATSLLRDLRVFFSVAKALEKAEKGPSS